MADNLSEALKKLKLASADSATDNVESCLDCLLKALAHNNANASEKVQEMGVLPLLPTLLAPQSSCTPKVANIIAEVAKNEFMRSPCVEAGLIPPLVQLLHSKDQEVLLQTGRALGNICYDSLLRKWAGIQTRLRLDVGVVVACGLARSWLAGIRRLEANKSACPGTG